jgi:ATP-dependent DNA ligase
VFAHACQLGAECIVSKKVDGAYQSDPCRVWIKVRNPASIAVQISKLCLDIHFQVRSSMRGHGQRNS